MCFSVKFLEVIKPFCSILPEIEKPERKVSLYSVDHFFVLYLQYCTLVNVITTIVCDLQKISLLMYLSNSILLEDFFTL